MSDNPEFRPLREQAKERNEKYEKIRERYEQRGPGNNNNNQKKEDQKMQNNLYMLSSIKLIKDFLNQFIIIYSIIEDSFKGELYNEEDFDHFNYFNSLREKQQAIERQDLNLIYLYKNYILFGKHNSRAKTVVTIEEKEKVEVSLVKQSDQVVSLKLNNKVQVRAKKISEPNKKEENTLNIKRERSDSQNEKANQDSPSTLKKVKPNESLKEESKSESIQPKIVKNDTKENKEAPKNEVKNLAAVLGYSSSSDSE